MRFVSSMDLRGAYPRVRPMIFTLGVNAVMRGLMVAHPRGLRAADRGEDLMRLLGAERIMRARGGPVGRHACRLRPIGTGDAYLLPAIDAVVVGGTSILGGRGRYLSTLFGIISIVLVNSVLSIMQMSGASRQTIRHRHYRHAARLWPR